MKTLYIMITAAMLTALLFFAGAGMETASADETRLSFSSTDGSACADIADGDYFMTEYFDPGTEITMTSQTPLDALYVVWENVPGEWKLRINGRDYTYGQKGYLHEYVRMPADAGQVTSVTLTVEGERITIADIYGLSAGSLPGFVQDWEDPCEEADVLLISTHADDEVLFFGGIIPNYTNAGNVRVQVAYFTDLFQSEPFRNHEILNGLWTMGVTHYPQLGRFYDHYSESLEEAQEQYNYDASLEYMVGTIRRFKPQVVIGQDPLNGEYGHGGHIWCARMVQDALEITADPQQYPDSASRYGTWDVPKAYFHLYPDNAIELNARKPLSKFGGKTELEVAKEAYLEHQSQQWCWFYVSDGYDEEGNPDGYEYSCTRYGLYRSLVGADFSGNDILDNIVTYDDQIKAAKEAAEEEARLAALETETAEETPSAQSVVDENSTTAVAGGKNTTAITVLIIIAAILLLAIIGLLVISRSRARIREQERKLERSRRDAEDRMRGRYRTNVQRSSSTYRTTSSGGSRTGSSAARSSSASGKSRQSTQSSQRTSRESTGTARRSSNGSYSNNRGR